MRIRSCLLIIIVVFCFALLSSCRRIPQVEGSEKGPISVTAKVDKTEIHIGDKVRYTIAVESEPDLEVNLPQFGENLGGFAIRNFGRLAPRKSRGRTIQEEWYLLDTYTTGSYTIPAPMIRCKGKDGVEQEIEGEEVKVEVKSLLTEGKLPEDVKDIKPPLTLPVNYATFVWVGTGTLSAIVGVLILISYLRRRRKRIEEGPPSKKAHEIAYQELRRIKSLGLTVKEYYIFLSDIVRHYLERRFRLRAPEMTTEEFLFTVAREKVLGTEHKLLLSDFLFQCDLVKFARYGASQTEMDEAYIRAERFINETKEEELEKVQAR